MKILNIHPPREYRVSDAFIGRVWRLKSVLIFKELMFWIIFSTVLCFLLKIALFVFFLGVTLLSLMLISTITYVILNLKRWQLVKVGPSVKGKIEHIQDSHYFHESIRGKAHRSCFATYSYEVDGKGYTGRIDMCRCALAKLQKQEELLIAYDVKNPKNSLPLKVAVMSIPH